MVLLPDWRATTIISHNEILLYLGLYVVFHWTRRSGFIFLRHCIATEKWRNQHITKATRNANSSLKQSVSVQLKLRNPLPSQQIVVHSRQSARMLRNRTAFYKITRYLTKHVFKTERKSENPFRTSLSFLFRCFSSASQILLRPDSRW